MTARKKQKLRNSLKRTLSPEKNISSIFKKQKYPKKLKYYRMSADISAIS
ncbi:hypothetical protein [Suttonella ornithocola]|nr:hypothetical protein [Suttonella ornithocola]